MAVSVARTLTKTQQVDVEPTLHMKLTQPAKKQNQVLPHLKPRKIKLDPLRALEPTRKKIATLEAQRVMSVFEETIKRVEITTLLPHIIQNLNTFRGMFGSELVSMMEKHVVIIQSYTEMRSEIKKRMDKPSHKKRKSKTVPGSRSSHELTDDVEEKGKQTDETELKAAGSRPSSSGSLSGRALDLEIDTMSRTLTLVAAQMSHSCKNILRMFTLNPSAVNAVLDAVRFRTPECTVLVNCLKTMRDILLGKLLTTPEEDKERMAYLDEVAERERQNAQYSVKLEAELKAAIEDKDDEIHKKNDIIRRLQSELRQIENASEEQFRRVKAEAEKQEAADIKNSDGKRQKLQQELSQLKNQLQNLIQEHHDSEQELRRKKYKVETEVENWIVRFDQDMGERQDEYEEIDLIYTEEKKQLHELEERFATLEEEYNNIMYERKMAREKREKAERDLATMVRCATTIQAFWRSYKVRKALKAKKKKGGKRKK